MTEDTIARWIRTVLHMSVENIAKYLAGSVQPVATLKDKAMAVPITHIMAKAGW